MALLERIVADRSLLDGLDHDERVRFLNAAGDVFSPDVEDRRQLVKARRRKEKLDKRQREEDALGETGIRRLRARPVFTTPNVFPPEGFEPAVEQDGPPVAGAEEERHCYVCKRHYTSLHHFYD